jgi:hypothetical protein
MKYSLGTSCQRTVPGFRYESFAIRTPSTSVGFYLHALVADPAGEAMTCGYAVNEAVDNSAHAWITTVILWTAEKNSVVSLGYLRRAGIKE